MEKEKLRDEIVANIRGCLISVKGKVDLRQLVKDYMQLMGSSIPYRDLGYQSLELFLRSVPSLSVSKSYEGQLLVDAKANEKTSHIASMVSRQKNTKKKPPQRHQNIAPRHKPNYKQAQTTTRWRPKDVSNNWKTYEKSSRPAAVSHNQFVNFPKSPQRLPAKMPLTTINNNTVFKNTPQQPAPVAVPAKISPQHHKEHVYKRQFSFGKEEGEAQEKTAHSSKTNRSFIMQKATARTSPLQSPTAIDNTKRAMWPPTHLENESDGTNGTDTSSFRLTEDPVADLCAFAKFCKLSDPIFKVMQRQSKPHKPIYFDCQVKVDSFSLSSYPNDYRDEHAAKYFVADLVLKKLVTKYGLSRRQSMLTSTDNDLMERIPALVKKHYHGVWSSQLEDDYKDLYNELLPPNWIEIINLSPVTSIETFGDKYVLRFCTPEDLLQKGKSVIPLTYDVSIPTSTIQFSEEGTLLAEITCAVSAKEIWCRQLETPEAIAYDMMLTEMETVYKANYLMGNKLHAPTITKGSYYVALIDDAWYRVRILELEENGEVQCLLVDRGDDQKVPKKNIFQLKREFAKEQAQAFICRLAGLEELYEVSVASEHLLNLEGRIIVLESCNIEESENAKYDPISVVVYDDETGLIINEELMSRISIENALPVLEEKAPTEVFISHIESNGDIYVQIRSLGYDKLVRLLKELQISINGKAPDLSKDPVTPSNSEKRLFFTKTDGDEEYYRVRIIDWSPGKDFAQIYYVDYGHTKVIKVKMNVLYPLDEISSIVSRYPEQALRVRLKIEKVPADFEQKIRHHLQNDASVLLRVVKKDVNGIPLVKMFVRIANLGLVSVNESVEDLQSQEKKIVIKGDKMEKIINLDIESKKNVPSTGILKCPPLPETGKYYDVRIPCAVNPWNFFVQPYDTSEALSHLMQKLQLRYTDIQHSPLNIDDIEPGIIYASKHEDGIWYRTSVIKVIHSGSISVYYCDFGKYANLNLHQLVRLDPEFLVLPYQAIKAKLSGIKPKQEKWTMDDCKYFEKRVTGKNFVSVLLAVEKDELYRLDSVLCLKLIDTSTTTDVNIEDILVMKDIAVRK